MILSLDPIIVLDPDVIAEATGIKNEYWLNRIVTYSLYFLGLVYLYELGRDLYRIYKLKT